MPTTATPPTGSAPDRIIREAECRELTGLSRSRRYELEQLGQFPRRVKLTAHAVGWHYRDIAAWIASRQPASHV